MTKQTRFDEAIHAACKEFLPDTDWRLYKAQLWQESRLDPDAESPAGALGIAQFMPGTWADMQAVDTLFIAGVQPQDAEAAIRAGAYYMRTQRDAWRWPRPWHDRYSLALASYNAGLGNLLEAQRRANMASDYAPIIRALAKVTGRHAQETTAYAPRIYAYWSQLIHAGHL